MAYRFKTKPLKRKKSVYGDSKWQKDWYKMEQKARRNPFL